MGQLHIIYDDDGTPIKLILNEVEVEGLAADELRKLRSKIKSREQVKRQRVKPHAPSRRYNPRDWSFSFESIEDRAFERELELMLGITDADKARHYKLVAAREAKREKNRLAKIEHDKTYGTKEQIAESESISFGDLMRQLDNLI